MALLPANIVENTVYSHQGLTIGGMVTDNTMKSPLMLEIFNATLKYLKSLKLKKFIYIMYSIYLPSSSIRRRPLCLVYTQCSIN